MANYELLPQFNTHQVSGFPISQISLSAAIIPSEFLSEAVFAGGGFWGLEAAFGRVDGVIKTATGYCGGTLRKPSYIEVKVFDEIQQIDTKPASSTMHVNIFLGL
ncbi:hypothetical protein PTKIN_Ptkin12aG0050800 [Pterospermum kingtungense]